MKKFMMMVMAACAISFTSCGSKSQNAPSDEKVSVIDGIDIEAAANEITSQISAQVDSKNVDKLLEAIKAIQVKAVELIKQNPEAAKAYIARVQEFLKDNKDKIVAAAGEKSELVEASVKSFVNMQPETLVTELTNIAESVQSAGQNAADAANDAVNDAKSAAEDAARGAVESAKQAAEDKANEAVDAAKSKANEAVDAAADKAKKAMGL